MCARITWTLGEIPIAIVTASHLLNGVFSVVFFLNSYLPKNSAGRVVAAICAAPAVVLAAHGLLDGHKATCYPASGFQGNGGRYVMPQRAAANLFVCLVLVLLLSLLLLLLLLLLFLRVVVVVMVVTMFF